MASRSRTIAKSIPAWEDYLAWATAKTDGSWLFRGHGQKRWLLTPKIGRPDIAGPKGWNEPDEKALIDDFWRLARRYIDPLVEPLEVLALGQHYGLPTRLLDWTTDPLVAAWFALRDQKKKVAAVHAIRVPLSKRLKRDDFSLNRLGIERSRWRGS